MSDEYSKFPSVEEYDPQEVLWHKTPEWKLSDVIKDGLNPRFSAKSDKAIYLTDIRSKRRLGVELGVKKHFLDPEQLVVDKVLVSGATHYKYYGLIPPEALFRRSNLS